MKAKATGCTLKTERQIAEAWETLGDSEDLTTALKQLSGTRMYRLRFGFRMRKHKLKLLQVVIESGVCAGFNGRLYFDKKGTEWQWKTEEQIAETVRSTAQARMVKAPPHEAIGEEHGVGFLVRSRSSILATRGDLGLEVKQYHFIMIKENVGEAGIGVLAEWGAGEDEISCVPAEVAIFFANATQNQMDDGSCGGKGLAEARWVDPAKVCEPNSCCRVMDAKQKGYFKALQQFCDLEKLQAEVHAHVASWYMLLPEIVKLTNETDTKCEVHETQEITNWPWSC